MPHLFPSLAWVYLRVERSHARHACASYTDIDLDGAPEPGLCPFPLNMSESHEDD